MYFDAKVIIDIDLFISSSKLWRNYTLEKEGSFKKFNIAFILKIFSNVFSSL